MTAPEKGAGPVVSRVSVPVTAVLMGGQNAKTGSVFVIGGDDKIEKREVALGLKTIGKKDMKKTKGGLLPAVKVMDGSTNQTINFSLGQKWESQQINGGTL